MLIRRKFVGPGPEPKLGSIMFYGYRGDNDDVCVTAFTKSPGGFYGRLVRMLPGRVCEMDITAEGDGDDG